MGYLWRWLGGALVIAVALYAAAIALSSIAIPWNPAPFDSMAVTTSNPGWVNEARYFLLNKRSFQRPANRIVITGASTARDPFRPALIQSRVPGWEVANGSLSGAEIAEMSDLVDLYYVERQRGGAGRTIWVFAICYMQFRPDNSQPGTENPVASEAMRAGLYARRERRLVPRYPPVVERAVLAAMRPQAVGASMPTRVARHLAFDAKIPGVERLVAGLRGNDPVQRWIDRIRHMDLDQVSVPQDVQLALTSRRLADVGGDRPSPIAEYRRFASLLRRIRDQGDSVVIVDVPLPRWHLAAVSRSDARHEALLREMLKSFAGDRDVAYLSMRDLSDPENFFDSAHIEPRLWTTMSLRLGNWLRNQPLLHQ